MTAAHGRRGPAGLSALGAEGSASRATAVGGTLPAASGRPRAAAGSAAIADVGRPPAAAAPHCASRLRPPAPREEAEGPASRHFAPSPPCPLRAGVHVALPTVRRDPTPAVTTGRRWQRDSVKRVRKGSGRERGTVGAVRPRAPRCPRSPGRRLPHSGFPRQKPAAAGGRSVRGRRSAAAYGGAARSPRHPAAGRHPRVGRGRRDSAGNSRRGNRDRGAAGRPR